MPRCHGGDLGSDDVVNVIPMVGHVQSSCASICVGILGVAINDYYLISRPLALAN